MASASFRIDTSELRRMARDLEATVPGLKAEVAMTITESGGLVAGEARVLSSWSSRIPGSIRVVGSAARVLVRAGGDDAPHAPAFEHGGVPGTFRHPVFGHMDRWVPQGARPFMAPAAERKGPEMEARMRKGVDAVFRAAGF